MRFALLDVADCQLPRWGHDGFARPYWRLYWNATPGWSIRFSRRLITLQPRHIVLIPPETVYQGFGPGPSAHLYLHFICEGLPGEPLPGIHALPCNATFKALLSQLRASSTADERTCDALALACHALGRLPLGTYRARQISGPVAEAQALGLRYLHRAVTNTELARVAGMHVNAFIRRFRADTGDTPRQWHLRRRIDAACVALEADQSIDTVAERLGFCDRHHLTRVFTRMRGRGPAAYRETAGKENAGIRRPAFSWQ